MILEPAIDLKDGKVVRLKMGDFDTVHQVADDPVAVAQEFAAAGANVIHMVDLDGAKSGSRVNAAIVKEVAEQSGMKIEMGGGIRSMEDLKAVDAMGVWSSAPRQSPTRTSCRKRSGSTATASPWAATP